jgi:predicted RNA-binding Zn-ribbon protein involved in translation (DUF1610 family)
MNGGGKLLKRSQVARLFGMSPHTVTRWANEARIPSILTPGGQFRFPEQQILGFLGKEKQAKGEDVMAKKNASRVKIAKCPRCGTELSNISDLDLTGHTVRCPKCGFSNDLTTQRRERRPVVSDMDMVGASSMM